MRTPQLLQHPGALGGLRKLNDWWGEALASCSLLPNQVRPQGPLHGRVCFQLALKVLRVRNTE